METGVSQDTHRVTGSNHQEIKPGNVVLIHDDITRVNWKMAVIESVNKGVDGKIRSANIRTPTGRTNRPVAWLYPLELSEDTITNTQEQSMPAADLPLRQSIRGAAKRGQEVVKQWIASLHALIVSCMLMCMLVCWALLRTNSEHVL